MRNGRRVSRQPKRATDRPGPRRRRGSCGRCSRRFACGPRHARSPRPDLRSRADRVACRRRSAPRSRRRPAQGASVSPRCNRATSHSASLAVRNGRQGGIAVPARPATIVEARLSAGLSRSACGVSAGPRPPVRRMPWQEPQSCLSSRMSSRCRAGGGASESFAPATAGAPNALAAVAASSTRRNHDAIARSHSRYNARIHATSFFASSSLSLFGGIGIGPQTPWLPLITFCASASDALASPLYFLATSLYAGPITFLSTAWQAVQPLSVASFIWSSAAAEKAVASAAAPASRTKSLVAVIVASLVDNVLSVVDVELAGWSDQLRVLDHGLELARLVIDDDQGRLLVLCTPHREPDFVAGPVVFGLHDALRPFAQARPLGDRQHGKAFVEVGDVVYRDRLTDLGIGVERGVHPQILRLGMRLDEQRPSALALERAHDLPRVRLMLLRVGPDHRDRFVA